MITDLISSNQSAFLKGRQISDYSLLAHELIRDFRKKQAPKGCCLKIDLHKAFDSVNREFVISIMRKMGFPDKWLAWIKECISTPTFSIMINGSPIGFFFIAIEVLDEVTHSHLMFLC